MAKNADAIEAELAKLDAEEGGAPSKSVRRYAPAALAMVVVASFAGVVWYAYSTGIREGSEFAAPTLKPSGPSKIAPKNPGGQEIRDQDKLVYGRIDKSNGGRRIERLLPPPENPMPAPVTVKPVSGEPKLGVPNPPPISEMPPPPPSITAPRPPVPVAVKPADKAAALKRSDTAAPVLQKIAPASGTPKMRRESAKAVAPERKKTRVKVAAVAASRPGLSKGFRIQISSVRSAEAAKRAWQNTVKRHGAVLSQLSLLVKRADLGEKGVFYRVQAGPLRDLAAARRVCDALKRKKVDCLVVKP